MFGKNDIYKKIKEVFPDVGEPEKDIQIDFDSDKKAWVIDLKKGNKHLKTYLEVSDADTCISKGQCVGLGVQIAQLKDNIEHMDWDLYNQ